MVLWAARSWVGGFEIGPGRLLADYRGGSEEFHCHSCWHRGRAHPAVFARVLRSVAKQFEIWLGAERGFGAVATGHRCWR